MANLFNHMALRNWVPAKGGPVIWPFGLAGSLTITNGQTVTLSANQVVDYQNLTINAGGVLNITGGWGIIGVAGNLINNGTIQNINNNYYGQTLTATTPLGLGLSYTIGSPAGGSGGIAGHNYGTAPTGQSAGNGGWGGQSWNYYSSTLPMYGAAPGGARGLTGGGIYIRCKGTISGNGHFYAYGNGGAGGTVGQYGDSYDYVTTTYNSCSDPTQHHSTRSNDGSGSGGGGAGGPGGYVYIQVATGGMASWTGTTIVTGGGGGAGGAASGAWFGGYSGAAGANGGGGAGGTYTLSYF
jgi:hypothetical protein